MPHRYERNPDHIRQRHVPAPDNAAITEHLSELLSPIVYSQQAYYRTLAACRSNTCGYDNEVDPIRKYQCHENLRALTMKQP